MRTNESINNSQPTERKTVIQISILALLFGTGSWIALSGLWLEMPWLMMQAPEKWSLASYLNIMIQLANIGPLIYWILHKRYKRVNDIWATHAQMLLGIFSCAMLAGFWNRTMEIFGQNRSINLLVFTFILGLVDCTSSVTFLPFMARFDSRYMTPYLIGEGLSGFMPSIVVLIQGARKHQHLDSNWQLNKATIINQSLVIEESSQLAPVPAFEPRFSVEIFFISLIITLFISYLAFICLQVLPFAIQERKSIKHKHKFDINQNDRQMSSTGSDNVDIIIELASLSSNHNLHHEDSKATNQPTIIHPKKYYFLLVLMFLNCFTTFGFMPPLQPYSALPYGPDILQYVTTITALSYPLGCFYAMLVEYRSIQAITILTIVSTGVAIEIIFCSWFCPWPPFVGTEWHQAASWFIIISWMLFSMTASYAKTMITLVICDYNRGTGMFWVGMNTQFGGAIGSLIVFIIINYLNVFSQCSSI